MVDNKMGIDRRPCSQNVENIDILIEFRGMIDVSQGPIISGSGLGATD
jgi:hypothetical protein